MEHICIPSQKIYILVDGIALNWAGFSVSLFQEILPKPIEWPECLVSSTRSKKNNGTFCRAVLFVSSHSSSEWSEKDKLLPTSYIIKPSFILAQPGTTMSTKGKACCTMTMRSDMFIQVPGRLRRLSLSIS